MKEGNECTRKCTAYCATERCDGPPPERQATRRKDVNGKEDEIGWKCDGSGSERTPSCNRKDMAEGMGSTGTCQHDDQNQKNEGGPTDEQ